MGIETILSICLGLGLSAATGFRIFVPLLVVNLAARAGLLSLAPSFEWIGGTEALVTFGIATALEVGAYYVPWLDNFLDTVATPASAYLKWTLAVIAGGGVAGAVQAVTVGTRQASALTTAGFGNPVVSTVEMAGSLGLSVLSILLPALAVVLVALFLVWAGKKLFRLRKAI
jgi:hypothetical protein